ncbi:MAG: nucleotidyltransferase family protein [bacterium]
MAEDRARSPIPAAVVDLWKSAGRPITLVVEGNSMRPLVSPGDRATIRTTAPAKVRRGDLVAFRQGDRIVVHRCLGRRTVAGRRWLCEKGDGQARWRWVPQDRVAGRVDLLERNGRVRDMSRWPWCALNRLLGLTWACTIAVLEDRGRIGRDRELPAPPVQRPGAGKPTAVRILGRLSRLALSGVGALAGPGRQNRSSTESAPLLTDEERLLILAARVELSHEEAAAAMKASLSRPLDWAFLEKHSETLGLQPLLFRHLSRVEFRARVPPRLMDRLERSYRRQSMKNLRLYSQLHRVLEALEEAAIPVVLLKGASLARTVYGDIGLRPMSDLDLLCREPDQARARKTIVSLGYPEQATFVSPRHEKLSVFFHGKHPSPLFHPHKTKIEIHSNIFPQVPHRPEDMESVWREVQPATLDGRAYLSLSAEDQLLHLVLHLDQHRVSGPVVLVWFCDIHELVHQQAPQIRWELFVRKVKSLGVCSQAGTTLGLLNAYWMTPIPAWVLEQTGGHRDERVLAAAIRQQGVPGELARRIFSSHRDRLLLIRRIPGWRGRLAYLLRFIFPTSDYLRHRYHVADNRSVWHWYLRHPALKARRLGERLAVLLREPSPTQAKTSHGRR